jgi:hypothetical protein
MVQGREIQQTQIEAVTHDLEHGKTATAHALLDGLPAAERSAIQAKIIEQNAADIKANPSDALPTLSLADDGRSIHVKGFVGTEQLWKNRTYKDQDEYTPPAEDAWQWMQNTAKSMGIAFTDGSKALSDGLDNLGKTATEAPGHWADDLKNLFTKPIPATETPVSEWGKEQGMKMPTPLDPVLKPKDGQAH